MVFRAFSPAAMLGLSRTHAPAWSKAGRARLRQNPRTGAPNALPTVNDLTSLLGLQAWKPVLTALLLPPVPWILMILVGCRSLTHGRWRGWWLVLPALAGLWLGSTAVAADGFCRWTGLNPAPLAAGRQADLARALKDRGLERPGIAVVVLGGGRERHAPAYGMADLSAESLARLRYGVWLSRATGAPLAFSGGTGWAQPEGPAEAEIAARIAEQEFRQPLRWIEARSRDTRENARLTLPMLRADGVRQVLLVTHGWHMQRALRAFRDEAGDITVEPAPMGLLDEAPLTLVDWLPSSASHTRTRQAVREWIGLWWGA
jgi:uncharacterized SAM-binding protein YcdF (DUF218 family)